MDNVLYYETAEGAAEPQKAHKTDAGFDLFVHDCRIVQSTEGESIRRYSIATGVSVAIPEGYVGLVLPRSSISMAGVLTHTGVIDAGYTGFIRVFLTVFNPSFTPSIGMKIAQLVVLPLPDFTLQQGMVSALKTERGSNGFGSTGR